MFIFKRKKSTNKKSQNVSFNNSFAHFTVFVQQNHHDWIFQHALSKHKEATWIKMSSQENKDIQIHNIQYESIKMIHS